MPTTPVSELNENHTKRQWDYQQARPSDLTRERKKYLMR
jgi:hypothetical protein